MESLKTYNDFNDKANDFAKYITINSFIDLENELNDLKKYNLLYRGLNNASFRIYSSAQRHWLWKDKYYKRIGGKNFDDFIIRSIDKARADKQLKKFLQEHQIPDNDFVILSLLQHYINISPLLDFTYSIETGLFFAIDNASESTGSGGLNDYISLYFVDATDPWIKASIQEINKGGIKNAEKMVMDYQSKNSVKIDCSEVLEETRKLPYHKYKDLPFISIAGPQIGLTKVTAPYLGFTCEYNMNNPRINSQDGCFILNTSADIPLPTQMNKTTNSYPKLMFCLDIDKTLIPEIKSKILNPNFISKETIYPSTKESKNLEQIIKSRFEDTFFKRIKARFGL